jgi:hypothetical protein
LGFRFARDAQNSQGTRDSILLLRLAKDNFRLRLQIHKSEKSGEYMFTWHVY